MYLKILVLKRKRKNRKDKKRERERERERERGNLKGIEVKRHLTNIYHDLVYGLTNRFLNTIGDS